MRIEFWTNLNDVSRQLSERARLRLESALDRFRSRLSHVRVRLVDENGARGGVDKSCKVQVVGRGGVAVLVIGRGADAPSLIDQVADRVGARVSHLIERSRESRRGPAMDGLTER